MRSQKEILDRYLYLRQTVRDIALKGKRTYSQLTPMQKVVVSDLVAQSYMLEWVLFEEPTEAQKAESDYFDNRNHPCKNGCSDSAIHAEGGHDI